MKLYEYEAKDIVKKYNIDVPLGYVVETPEEAVEAFRKLGKAVLKSQVLVGGRGLAGGIKKALSEEEAYSKARELLSMSIKGEKVRKLLVEELICISKEMYLSLTVDRATKSIIYLVSPMGGVEIEELAKKFPDKVLRIYVDPLVGYSSYMAREAVAFLGLPFEYYAKMDSLMRSMSRLMSDYDAELVEFNPLALTCDGKLMPVDAKIIVDDNALYRRQELQPLYGRELSQYERKAKELGFNYVELDGNIGVVSNGAGLTMATMDSILYFGGKPANFLDIGGGASRDRVREAIKLVLSHEKVEVLLVNIFGGITRCDEVANGIIDALTESKERKPVVVRMLGTNEEEGRRILESHGISVFAEMDEAVKMAVELSKR